MRPKYSRAVSESGKLRRRRSIAVCVYTSLRDLYRQRADRQSETEKIYNWMKYVGMSATKRRSDDSS